MKANRYCLIALTALQLACAGDSATDAARAAAGEWADSYFNCDYVRAASHSTAESERWLRLAASNTSQAKLDLLNERPAECEVRRVDLSGDTLAIATVVVSDYVPPTLLGDTPRRSAAEGTFYVRLVMRDGAWKVRMEGLPRSERQSRD